MLLDNNPEYRNIYFSLSNMFSSLYLTPRKTEENCKNLDNLNSIKQTVFVLGPHPVIIYMALHQTC